jgi:hypothetical protein
VVLKLSADVWKDLLGSEDHCNTNRRRSCPREVMCNSRRESDLDSC